MPGRVMEQAKTCEACGRAFSRRRFGKRLEDSTRFKARRFCSQSCANTKATVTKDAMHWRARKHVQSNCQECGTSEGLHVHHVDRNPANNEPANLMTPCSSCHLKLHWREDRGSRMEAVRRAAATAAMRGAFTRPRSTDGRFCSVA